MKEINEMISKPSEWVRADGPQTDIAISTRVRVARNISGDIFFGRATDEQRAKTLDTVFSAVAKSKYLSNALFLKMAEVNDLDKYFLLERHLISKEHMEDAEFKGTIIGDKEIVSAMVNEEDHLRLQVIRAGSNITDAWQILDEIDTEIGQLLNYEFSSHYGYLTSCPTNTGTGLRASVMLHLPAIAITGQIENVFDAISKLGLTMRGFYGEGTAALGDFFQISNQETLGHSETEILDNLKRIINKIIAREQKIRADMMARRQQEVSDRVFRSYGTLKSARIITSNEAIKLLSAVRLGVNLGIIHDISVSEMNELLIFMQAAHLQKLDSKPLDLQARDIKRADLIRSKLGVE